MKFYICQIWQICLSRKTRMTLDFCKWFSSQLLFLPETFVKKISFKTNSQTVKFHSFSFFQYLLHGFYSFIFRRLGSKWLLAGQFGVTATCMMLVPVAAQFNYICVVFLRVVIGLAQVRILNQKSSAMIICQNCYLVQF